MKRDGIPNNLHLLRRDASPLQKRARRIGAIYLETIFRCIAVSQAQITQNRGYCQQLGIRSTFSAFERNTPNSQERIACVSAMGSLAVATRRTYVDRESLNRALTSDLVGWTVSETREAPLLTHVVSHRLGDIRLVELSANPFRAVRGRAEISGDSVTYLGILYQRFGSTLCRRGDDRVIVARRTGNDPKFDGDGDNCDPHRSPKLTD
jgi:hypothetical protein